MSLLARQATRVNEIISNEMEKKMKLEYEHGSSDLRYHSKLLLCDAALLYSVVWCSGRSDKLGGLVMM